MLYPDFKRLFREITQMGVVLQLNTNGTLIDEEWADYFCKTGVRWLNITLYGIDDATYGSLCGNPKGFTQVMHAAELLKERKVPFRFYCSLTPENIDQLSEFHRIAKSFGVTLSPAAYMFPGARRGVTTQEQYRLTPEDAAIAKVYALGDVSAEDAKAILRKLDWTPHLKDRKGFPCHVGRSDFSINWKGELLPCISFQEPRFSLLNQSFKKCWAELVSACMEMPQCLDCKECELQNVCLACPAHCYSETGRSDGRPDYICQMTKCMVDILKKITSG